MDTATVVDAGAAPQVGWVSDDLGERGVRRLMVEGGQHVLSQFLEAGSPTSCSSSWRRCSSATPGLRASSPTCGCRAAGTGPHLAEVRRIEDVVLLRYALSARFEQDDQGGTTR